MQNNTAKFKKELMSREKKLWGKSTAKIIADKQIKVTEDLIKSIKDSYVLNIKKIKKTNDTYAFKNKYLQLIILKNGNLEIMTGHIIDELNGTTEHGGTYFNVPANVPSIKLVKIQLNNNDLRFTVKSFELINIQSTLDLTKDQQDALHKIIENSKTKKHEETTNKTAKNPKKTAKNPKKTAKKPKKTTKKTAKKPKKTAKKPKKTANKPKKPNKAI